MELTAHDIVKMMDLSFVKTNNTEEEIIELVNLVKSYQAGHISVLQCYVPFVKDLIRENKQIKLVGNVGFPSGSESTSIKVQQTKELKLQECDEIDVVMNIGFFLSGKYFEVEEELKAIIEEASPLPVKVIIETPYLNSEQILKASEICLKVGANFVKTGTGWTTNKTDVKDVELIKSVVGEHIGIKASGGIRSLDELLKMYKRGARRFGVNVNSGKKILNECIDNSGKVIL